MTTKSNLPKLRNLKVVFTLNSSKLKVNNKRGAHIPDMSNCWYERIIGGHRKSITL